MSPNNPPTTSKASPRSPVLDAVADPAIRGRLLSVTRRIAPTGPDAEDAFQDAMVQALAHANRFRADSRVSTWLHRIAVNAALMGRRRAANWSRRWVDLGGRVDRDADGWPATPMRARLDVPDPSPSAEQQLVELQQRQQLRLAISLLSTQSRRTIEALLDDAPVADSSPDSADGRADATPNALRARLSRARSRLRQVLQGLDLGLPRTA
jgi:RNA polymerase sigma-70 factor (ECF subfamily)